jgi:NAD+ synthase (glutamine-hydrolysing)
MLHDRAKDCGLAIVYSNLVGGQDELVFDGRSMLMSADGGLSICADACEEKLPIACFQPGSGQLWFEGKQDHSNLDGQTVRHDEDITACIYTVLVRGLKDYVVKNGFTDVVIGLSGGIDSALTLALAADALGADHVHAVMMPSRHTSDLSLQLARQQTDMLEIDYREISIEPAYEALLDSLEVSFKGCQADVTEENLQARVRGNLLMALSNKFGWMVLATGNKSELAVGYSTIYGDMCGGFAPIKDCLKTRVYALCAHRNTISPAIPQAVIERAPSAELAPGQLDQDSLPEYELLDRILYHYIEQDWSIADIVDAGFDESVVRRVAAMVIRNEYKRRQAAPGVRITSRAFGRDRRYPITSVWHEKSIRKT